MRRLSVPIGVAACCLFTALLALPASGAAQGGQAASSSQVTAAEVQRLQDALYDVGADIRRFRGQDAVRAERLQAQLDDLHDEVIYLKVKQRKEGVSRSEVTALRDELDDLRAEARRAMPAAAAAAPEARGATSDRPEDAARPARQGTTARPNEVPEGTELDVRLDKPLSSETAQVDDHFNATTLADLYNGNRALIPAGSIVRGVVTSVTKAGRIERTGKLTLVFDRVTVGSRSYPMHGSVTQALQSGGYRQDAGKIGAAAGVGAIIGGILGGFKGAMAGILIGGGGVVAATEGQDVNLTSGTVLRLRLDSAIIVK